MHFERLILVPGHAIWSGEGSPADESTWFLKHFQTGEAIYLLDHIRAGVELAAADPNALLIVSGGPSDVRAGARSEARAAFDVAEHYGWWDHPHVKARFLPEEHALDSFQNLLFGLCTYRMRAGAWPAAITVAGWGFKGDRFRHLHRAALRWTRPFDYIDVNDPPHVERASGFEQETCRLFETDPHGSVPPLSTKREQRDHLRLRAPYGEQIPELAALLEHKDTALYTGPLPWDEAARPAAVNTTL